MPHQWRIIFWDYGLLWRWRRSLNICSGSEDGHRNEKIMQWEAKCSDLTIFLISNLLGWFLTEERGGVYFWGRGTTYTKDFLAAFLLKRIAERIIIDQCGKQGIWKVKKTMVKRFMNKLNQWFQWSLEKFKNQIF